MDNLWLKEWRHGVAVIPWTFHQQDSNAEESDCLCSLSLHIQYFWVGDKSILSFLLTKNTKHSDLQTWGKKIGSDARHWRVHPDERVSCYICANDRLSDLMSAPSPRWSRVNVRRSLLFVSLQVTQHHNSGWFLTLTVWGRLTEKTLTSNILRQMSVNKIIITYYAHRQYHYIL